VEFMAKYFSSNIVTDEIEKLRIGAAQQNLSLTQLKNLYVPLPPLPEQQRIVSILDRAFAAIDKAKANAEQNLQNAKELFESSLQGVFEKKGDGWEEKQLDEVCSIGDGNYSSKYPKASEFVKSGVPFLTATNLKNGTVLLEGIRFISKEQHSTLTKGHIIQGDLVIVVRGSSTGNNSIVPHSYEGSNLNSQLAFLRVKDRAYLDSDFLFAVFNSPQVMKKVKAKISGAAQPQLPNNKLLEISIHIPSLKEQQTIVSQLDALRSETQKLEAVYQKKMDDLEELKKSILQKAFAGDLPTRQAGLETEKVVAV
jgi:type I restriction enzyme S subunit